VPLVLGEIAWNQTALHPVGLAAVLVLGVALLVVPRAWAVLPMIVMACFVASAQRVVVGGLDFNLLRILLIFGWVRVLAQGETTGFILRPIDVVMLVYAIAKTCIYTLQQGTAQAVVFQFGQTYDTVGMYFLFRVLIRGWEDVHRIAMGFAVVSLPVCAAFAIEHATGRNAFAMFGGVPAVTNIRDGRLRCQGAFSHPILAGCFWAAVLPLIAAMWWRRDQLSRLAAVAGAAAGLGIVFFCASSTPVAAVFAAACGAALFVVRGWMGWLRLGTVVILVALHMVMKAPVWHLVSRIDLAGGSTGWHRYHLIDEAINRFGEWAVLGTASTAHWGRQLFDVTNQYVLEGVRGGALGLALFLAIMVLAFREVGRLVRAYEGDRTKLVAAWSLGVCLAVQAVAFIAVSYFGQITMLWYLAVAMPVSLASGLVPARVAATRRRMVVVAPKPRNVVAGSAW
jgi:hypothetical protein